MDLVSLTNAVFTIQVIKYPEWRMFKKILLNVNKNNIFYGFFLEGTHYSNLNYCTSKYITVCLPVLQIQEKTLLSHFY